MIVTLGVFLRRTPGLLIAALVLAVAGCSRDAAPSANAAGPGGGGAGAGKGGGRGGRGGAGGPAPVIVAQVQRKVVPLVIEAIGVVEPIRTAAIRSQITGTLMKIAIQEGQDVKQGDLLFQIDPRPFENALRSSEADRAKLHVQLDNARAQVARYRELSTEQAISAEQYRKLEDDARALEAQSLSADAAVANAKLQLEYCAIRAPLSGRTGNLNVHEGDLVRSNSASDPPLVTINQLSPIYVTFGVPQQHLAAINRFRAEGSLAISAVPPGGEDHAETGALTFVDNTVDQTTGTIKLKGTFTNESRRLWPGQFVTTGVTLDRPEVIAVPTAAIQNSQAGQQVFVVHDDKLAELRPVVIERSYESDAVVSKGLREGETVVIDGQLRVMPGRPVEIKQVEGSKADAIGGNPAGHGGEGRGKKKKTAT